MQNLDVIVIGGSAGALDALLAILPEQDLGWIPIVVALHLAPNERSVLPSVLAQACRRTVCEVEDKAPMRERYIYVTPPNYHVLLERDRTLALSVDDAVHFSRPSIDVLFDSAADAFGAGVAGVLLSGANDDGARGLCRICDGGGVALVQHPDTAEYPAMPVAGHRRIGGRARVHRLGELACALKALGTPPHQDALP